MILTQGVLSSQRQSCDYFSFPEGPDIESDSYNDSAGFLMAIVDRTSIATRKGRQAPEQSKNLVYDFNLSPPLFLTI